MIDAEIPTLTNFKNIWLVNKYEFMKDAYYGGGGYINGSYLVPHDRETSENYTKRLNLAFYPNYVKPVINSHINPIFKNEGSEEYKENKFFEEFKKNSDKNRTTFQRLIKRAARRAKTYGALFAIVDNEKGGAQSVEDALKGRAFPFVILINPISIHDIETDTYGKMILFEYREDAGKDENGDKKENIRSWTASGWELWEAIKNGSGYEKVKLIDSGINPIGEIPVSVLYPFDNDSGDILPNPEFYDLARVNYRLYNLKSEITQLERDQTFSILTYPGKMEQLTAGPKNAIGYDPSSSSKPEFISPDAGQLKILVENGNVLADEIYRQAMLTHMHAGGALAQSGVAKEWDFEVTSQVLSDFSNNIEEFQNEIVRLFGKWIKSDLQYSVHYEKKFGLVSVLDELDQALRAQDVNFGASGNAEFKKKAAEKIFQKEPDRLDLIIESIDQETQDLINFEKNNPLNNPNPNNDPNQQDQQGQLNGGPI